MKTIIVFLSIMLVLFFGCNEKKSKIEIIPNYDAIYLPVSKVSEAAVPMDSSFNSDIQNIFKNIVEKIQDKKDTEPRYYEFEYRFYINKDGKIDKVKTLENHFHNAHITQKERSKATNLLIQQLERFRFIPAKMAGQNVKSRYDIEIVIIFKNGKVSVVKYDNLGHFGEKNTDDVYFVAVEHMPSPIGGVAGIQKRISYPEKARKAGIQGRVFVKAFIDEKGNVVKTEIIKGIGGGCDEVAQNAVKQTKFIPGRQRGKAVKVQVSVPILFKMK